MRSLISVFIFLGFLSLPIQGLAQANASDEALAGALKNLNKGNVFDSIKQLKRIAKEDPSFDPAYYYLSMIYTELGEFETAERDINRAIAANPHQGVYYHQSGMIRFRQGKWGDALTLFDRALTAGAGRSEATVWHNIGDAHWKLFDAAKALDAYNSSIRLEPDDPQTHLALATVYLDENPQKAIQELRVALDLQPDLPEAFPSLGRAYRRLGDMDSAVGAYREAVDRNPGDVDSRYGLAQALLALGRRAEGRQELEIYQRIKSQVESADSNYRAAQKKLDAGQLEEAEELFAAAVELAPSYSPALYGLGSTLLGRQKTKEALKVLERAAAINNLNPDISFYLGTAYLRSNKTKAALHATERAIVLDDENAQYYRQLGEIYTRLGRLRESREAIDKSWKLETLDGELVAGRS